MAISFPDWGSYEESWLKLLQEIPLKKDVTQICVRVNIIMLKKKDFLQRFEIIYEKFASLAKDMGCKPSELAFARFIGVAQTSMQNWKKGSVPSARDLKTIHDKLGFAYDWLISGQGEMFDNTAQRLAEQERQIQELSARLCGNEMAAKASESNTAHAVGQE